MNAPVALPLLLAVSLTGTAAPRPIACNLHALSAAERARHAELIAQLRGAVLEHRELADGLRVRIDVSRVSLAQVGEWAALERRCCPFLHLELSLDPDAGPVWLALTGPSGTKEMLAAGLTG